MFQEAIAKLTAEHLRDHVEEFLDLWDSQFTGSDKITLVVPEVSSVTLVGGVMQAELGRLPLIGVDCLDKTEIPSAESLYYCEYTGAIVGLVSAASSDEVDRRAKRYNAVAELFIKQHQFLNLGQPGFMIREFYYVNSNMSGAIQIELEDEQPIWMEGFTINVRWVASEDQPRQHT